jgi:hypothetical protein
MAIALPNFGRKTILIAVCVVVALAAGAEKFR